MPTVAEVQKIQDEVQRLKDKMSRTQGVIEQLKKKHKHARDLPSLKKHLAALTIQRSDLESQLGSLVEEYRIAYHDKLGG